MPERVTPIEVLNSFYPDGINREAVLEGGKVNVTLLITNSNDDRFILQRLSPIFDESLAEDFAVVSNHLEKEGWEVAKPVRSHDGRYFVRDANGDQWRSYTYIESDGAVPAAGLESAVALSGLLGRLHNSLAKLDYTPAFVLPHFHDSGYYADKLESLLDRLTGQEIRQLGRQSIDLARERGIDPEPAQLIHGDPKLANALYRGGLPFTFIDFDNLMIGNPLVDVGDMLRSVSGKLSAKDPSFSAATIEPVIAAYYKTAKPPVSEAQFFRDAVHAGQVIALELCMRYLIDTVEAVYFDFDENRYDSHADHNAARARDQFRTFEALQS